MKIYSKEVIFMFLIHLLLVHHLEFIIDSLSNVAFALFIRDHSIILTC